ncbi:RAMP superfamily CRISPR-associated protein [Clostridium frigidicarnis]|uniref:RAMP superfamily CRISPR-associated protein n=1 Tax=Clostridium frigidicarnis TaxID=84698 RepID=UPI000B7FD89D|nr:RAMP superfamily CRISPR-associated protein [Clostridium frigidicarnis]
MNKINKIKQYTVSVKNISPLRIGNGGDEGNGVLLYNDYAIINGTTFSGLFREFLNQIKENIEDKESEEYKKRKIEYELVFPERDDEIQILKETVDNNKKEISKIYFYDSISQEKIKTKDLLSRNHVNIDDELGSSVEKHLFNEYHITEGKTFRLFFEIRGLELDLILYEKLCGYLEQFISRIVTGDMSIGSKFSFGFGRFKGIDNKENEKESKLHFKEYDLSKEEDLDSYLNFNMKCIDFEPLSIQRNNYNKNKVRVTLQAYCEEGFIIKGQQELDSENNIFDKCYEEYYNGKSMYTIPSSTIKGLIRNYCNKIYKTLNKDKKDIENMFGTKSDEKNGIDGKKGNVIFYDCKINKDNTEIYNRIKIDRFTGGTMTGSVFKEQVAIVSRKNPIEINVDVNENNKKALALIILSFRDIGLGYLTLGSGNNVGYGRFKGKSITVDGTCYDTMKIVFEDSKLTGNVNQINDIISILTE